MKLKYYSELDGVRALAALMVMFFHFFQFKNLSNNILLNYLIKFSKIGQSGVTLFFVLSGFLITRILLNQKTQPNYFKNFYIRRSLRIFPLYYLFLILYLLILPFFGIIAKIPFGQQFYFWIYFQNIAMTLKWQINGPGHYWSLAVEEHFYLIWPILIYYFNDKKLKYIFILLILLSILSRYILLKNHLETFYFTTSRMSDLIFGAFLSLYETKLKLKKIIILLLTILTFKIVLFYNFIFLNNIIFESFSFIFLTSIYTLIIGIMLLTKNNNIFKKALQSFYFRFTGKVSYGLYIYHPLVLIIVEKYLKINNLIFNILTCFLITYLISYLSFIFFESKFLNLKQKY